MESLDRRRAGAEQEEGFGMEARRATDLGMVPNLRRSNSSLSKSRRLLCPFIEKVGFPLADLLHHGPQKQPNGHHCLGHPGLVKAGSDHRAGSFLTWVYPPQGLQPRNALWERRARVGYDTSQTAY